MEPSDYRHIGIDANMETWAFLQKPSLTEEEKDQMIEAVYASLYLWEKSGLGTQINQARGHWLISRVMCVAGNVQLAERHATLCAHYTSEATDREDFDAVYVVEAEARVAAMHGQKEKARALRTKAMEMVTTVADEEGRKLLASDIDTEPWFGLSMA